MSHAMRNLFLPYANNKGADQSAHPHSLISAFVVCCLDGIIPPVSISKILSLYLSSAAAQDGLSLPWLQTPKTGSHDEAHIPTSLLVLWIDCDYENSFPLMSALEFKVLWAEWD